MRREKTAAHKSSIIFQFDGRHRQAHTGHIIVIWWWCSTTEYINIADAISDRHQNERNSSRNEIKNLFVSQLGSKAHKTAEAPLKWIQFWLETLLFCHLLCTILLAQLHIFDTHFIFYTQHSRLLFTHILYYICSLIHKFWRNHFHRHFYLLLFYFCSSSSSKDEHTTKIYVIGENKRSEKWREKNNLFLVLFLFLWYWCYCSHSVARWLCTHCTLFNGLWADLRTPNQQKIEEEGTNKIRWEKMMHFNCYTDRLAWSWLLRTTPMPIHFG